MSQEFIPVGEPDRAVDRILADADRGDVYIGAAPRFEAAGGRRSIRRVWALRTDCDSTAAVQALERFEPAPHLVLASGTPGNLHAWWSLRRPLSPDEAERANRRLAHYLGADMRATDAARIMRPAGTLNHKHAPPRPVELIAFVPVMESPTAREIVGEIPDPPEARAATVKAIAVPPARHADVLLTIAATDYVPALIGRPVGRDGKVVCPWHGDGRERTPSLHCYEEPERGWHCFACEAGGSIYDFAARLWGIRPRGAGFHEVRRRLAIELLHAEGTAA